MKIIFKLFTVLFSLILLTVILEVFLRLKGPSVNEKFFLGNQKGDYANCYTTDPSRYYPMDLKDSTVDRETLKETFEISSGDLEYLMRNGRFCILYNSKLRQIGFNPERSQKLFLFGDSFTFSEGLKEEDSLGKIFNEKVSSINARNFGRSGANVENVLEIMKQVFKNSEKNQSIYFYNLNDVLVTESLARKQKYVNDFENIRWSNFDREYGHEDFALWEFLKRLIHMQKETDETIEFYNDIYNENVNLGIQNTKKILAEMKPYSIHLVIYPLLAKSFTRDYPFRKVHQEILKWCQEIGLSCIDGLEAFDQERNFYKYKVHSIDFHPNRKAQEKMVDFVLSKKILEL